MYRRSGVTFARQVVLQQRLLLQQHRVYCSSSKCCCCCCCGLCSSTTRWWSIGSHPTEPLVEQDCVSSEYCYVCLIGRKQLSHGMQTRKKTQKTTALTQFKVKKHISVAHAPFSTGRTQGPGHGPARQIHGSTHAVVGVAHMEPVFHGPRCHVTGRAGSGPAGPRP